jgi:hypothetical protein
MEAPVPVQGSEKRKEKKEKKIRSIKKWDWFP